jgi:hypothetical protein
VTGDGNADVVFGSGAAIVVHPGLGGGVFGAAIVVPMPGIVTVLTPIASGDADGDGPDDVVAVHFDANQLLHIAWVVSNAGSFTVHSGPGFPLYTGVDALAVLDFQATSRVTGSTTSPRSPTCRDSRRP